MLRTVRVLCVLGRRGDAKLVAREFAQHCRVDPAATEAIVALVERAALVDFAPGAEVMRGGEPCDSISVILSAGVLRSVSMAALRLLWSWAVEPTMAMPRSICGLDAWW